MLSDVVVQTVKLFLTCLYVCVDNNLEDLYVVRYFERTIQCKSSMGINHIPINQLKKELTNLAFEKKLVSKGKNYEAFKSDNDN